LSFRVAANGFGPKFRPDDKLGGKSESNNP